ncbi:MAG TPA: NmrA family NAD(P)-binding protein [Alphaproteobacteria bacterium]|jgi:uncharacterized protein YbjT (DUF2867 family)
MYVVTGASGNTGAVVADTLLKAGKPVRVVVRDAAKGETWKKRGAEVALATFDDAAALTRAFARASGLYLMTPPLDRSQDMVAERAPMIAALVKAAKDAAVPHVVALSSIGAQHAAGTGPIVSLHDLETRLAGAGLRRTVLRPGSFAENWGDMIPVAQAQGVLPAMMTPERRIPTVATPDIGRAAAAALLDPPATSRIVALAGPRDVSPAEVATALATLLGRPVQVAAVPPEGREAAMREAGLPAKTAALYAEMSGAIDSGLVDYEGTEVKKRGSETIEETLRRLISKA